MTLLGIIIGCWLAFLTTICVVGVASQFGSIIKSGDYLVIVIIVVNIILSCMSILYL